MIYELQHRFHADLINYDRIFKKGEESKLQIDEAIDWEVK